MKPFVLASVVLLAWGIVKIPWEMTMDAHRRQVSTVQPFTGTARNQLGHGLAIAALGGFRGLAANFAWIEVTEAWEKNEWTRLRGYVELATTLQPRVAFFWDIGAWHLAWNASIAESQRGGASVFAQERQTAGSRQWILAGKELLERGVEALPDNVNLRLRLGDLYAQRLHDWASAAEQYKRAAQLPDALPFVDRLVGMALEKAGQPEAALAYFRDIWNNHPEHLERSPYHRQVIREEIEKREQIKKMN